MGADRYKLAGSKSFNGATAIMKTLFDCGASDEALKELKDELKRRGRGSVQVEVLAEQQNRLDALGIKS